MLGMRNGRKCETSVKGVSVGKRKGLQCEVSVKGVSVRLAVRALA